MKRNLISNLTFFLLFSSITCCFVGTFFIYMPSFNNIKLLSSLQYIWLIFGTVLGLIIIFLIGYTILNLLPKNKDFNPFVKVSLSYGLGTGFNGLSMFIFILLGFHSRFSFIPLLVIIIFLFIYYKNYIPLNDDIKKIMKTIKVQKFNKIEYFCIFLLAVISVYLFIFWFFYPIENYDAIFIWDAKAKLIFYEGNFENIDSTHHPTYPLLVPLNLCFFYTIYFQHFQFSRILILTYFFTLISFLYFSLRGMGLNKTISIIIITLYAVIGQVFILAIHVKGDMPLTFFYSISSIFLFYYFHSKKKEFLVYSSVFMGFMAWCKIEGLALLVINISILIIYHFFLLLKKTTYSKDIFKLTILYTMISFIIYIPWFFYISFRGFPAEYITHYPNIFDIQSVFSDLINIFIRGFILILNPYKWGIIFWFVFFSILIFNLNIIKKNQNTLFLLFMCFFHFLVYILIYLITPLNLNLHLIQSFDRMVSHIVPLCCFLIGNLILNNEKLNINYNENILYKKMLYFFSLLIITSMIIIIIFYNPIFYFIKHTFPYYDISLKKN